MAEIHDLEKLKQSLKVAEMYYEDDLSQTEISKSVGISRPTISRLLQYAKDNGLVKIQIVNPLVDAKILEKQLKQKYGVNIYVVSNNYGHSHSLQERVGKYAADFLAKVVRHGDVIGLGWGKTIHAITQQVEEQAVSDVRVVELKGSLSYSEEKKSAYESVNELARVYHTSPDYLPLPVIFDNKITKKMVERDRYIKRILDLGRSADIALFTVGTVRSDALIFQLGYFNDEEKKQLQQEAIGDVFSRFVDRNGEIVNQQIDDRTIGIKLDELRNKKYAILVATGKQKTAGVHAVLKAGYANQVIIDQGLAQLLLDM